LQLKITPLKECFADRPGIFLIHVLNTDSKPMEKDLDLVVSYATPGRVNAAVPTSRLDERFAKTHESKGEGAQSGSAPARTPIRHLEVTLPALGPGEARTLPIRLTPRRIGELQIAISPKLMPRSGAQPVLATARLPVKFDPTANLVPVRAGAEVPSRLPQKLADVPEVSLEDSLARGLPADEGFEHIAHLIEKINHVNTAKTDAFVEALIARRSDVGGLPYTMGDACRLSAERGQQFLSELRVLRGAMGDPANLAKHLPNPTSQPSSEATIKARVAALVQVVGPEGAQLGQEMVKYLAKITHMDATRALAKLAIFSEEDQVRKDALAALTVRRVIALASNAKAPQDQDYTDILLAGLNYPWPAVAERAADAIVQLKRQDLAPQLVEVLDRPDPRAPQLREKDSKKVPVVREVVRINHLRNCLLCHSPGSPAAVQGSTPDGDPRTKEVVDEVREVRRGPVAGELTAPVPVPGQQLSPPSPSGYGRSTIPDILVKFDVTYLRQDFSVKLPVADAQPWPAVQRFDFLVRTRELTEPEAEAYRALLRPTEASELSPYQRAAVASLRQLTGRDAEPTAAAWRQLLAQSKTEK
jgi:hypothetical protein